ncbi:hypothetical protein T06_2914 [Trichinella sp. T6]|nr:hypothetical protein T06_2914 [Trichinella sp. T6]
MLAGTAAGSPLEDVEDVPVAYVDAAGTFEGPWSSSAASIASRKKKRTIKLLSSQSRVKVTLPDYVVVYVHAFGTFEGPWSGSAASIASRGKKRTIKLLSSQSWVKVTLPDYVVVVARRKTKIELLSSLSWVNVTLGCLSRSNVRVPTDGGTGNPWKSDSAYHTYNIAGVRRIHGMPVGNNCSETGEDLAKLRSFIREPVLSNCRTFSGMSATNAHDTTFSHTSSKKLATTEQSRQLIDAKLPGYKLAMATMTMAMTREWVHHEGAASDAQRNNTRDVIDPRN